MPPCDFFLLSDGATTWGEDNWPVLAGLLRAAAAGPLFAYTTGMAGTEGRLLARLAEQSGGAVFSVVGDAEIARASTAHRFRPWRLAHVEAAGGSDLLVAGRPQFVFPDQQLLVVGRGTPDPDHAEVVLTLTRDKETRQVRTKIDRVLASELAARAYGQVAVGQLEDLADANEPVARSYARHFRVTGRTCSLLMLDTEADYARFQIKPEEEDAYAVKVMPASEVVSKALEELSVGVGNPKSAFMAWFRNLTEKSGPRFALPSSLEIALRAMPEASFVIVPRPLRCKVHNASRTCRRASASNSRPGGRTTTPSPPRPSGAWKRWAPTTPCGRSARWSRTSRATRPSPAASPRPAMAWGLGEHGYHLFRRAGAARTYDPTIYYGMARCLEETGHGDLAMVYYELVCGGQWEGRFGDVLLIASDDYLRFLRRAAGDRQTGTLGDFARTRLKTFAPAAPLEEADLVVVIAWNTDGTDVDLHVTEPGGEECYYRNRQTATGGQLSCDVTTGYGPERYVLRRAAPGTYYIRTHYFASDANRASTRTTVYATIYEGWGTKHEKVTRKAVDLSGRSEMQDLAKIVVADPSDGKNDPRKDPLAAR